MPDQQGCVVAVAIANGSLGDVLPIFVVLAEIKRRFPTSALSLITHEAHKVSKRQGLQA